MKVILPDYSDLISRSAEETISIAESFSEILSVNDYVYLKGQLGAGKTVFSSGIIMNLTGIDSFITSPTYSLVKQYVNTENGFVIYHFDLYRLSSYDELVSTGYFDYKDGLIISEWCENVPESLPDKYYEVDIKKTDLSGDDLFSEPDRLINIYKIQRD